MSIQILLIFIRFYFSVVEVLNIVSTLVLCRNIKYEYFLPVCGLSTHFPNGVSF